MSCKRLFVWIIILTIFSLRHLGSQLSELEKLIDIMIQEEFHKHVATELNRPVSDLTPLLDEVCSHLDHWLCNISVWLTTSTRPTYFIIG